MLLVHTERSTMETTSDILGTVTVKPHTYMVEAEQCEHGLSYSLDGMHLTIIKSVCDNCEDIHHIGWVFTDHPDDEDREGLWSVDDEQEFDRLMALPGSASICHELGFDASLMRTMDFSERWGTPWSIDFIDGGPMFAVYLPDELIDQIVALGVEAHG